MTFNEYVLNWWEDTVNNKFTDEMSEEVSNYFLTSKSDFENIKEYLLYQDDAFKIYSIFFGSSGKYSDKFNTEQFLTDMFKQASPDIDYGEFVTEFISNLSYYAIMYDDISEFFKKFFENGFQSGSYGFIYYHECVDFYTKHIYKMEKYKEDSEAKLGETWKNINKLFYPKFMCCACCEEITYNIANKLFPNKF